MKVGGALYSIGGMPTAMSNMRLCHPKNVFFWSVSCGFADAGSYSNTSVYMQIYMHIDTMFTHIIFPEIY